MKRWRAELVSTGAELLSGRSVNTHAQYLGTVLGRLGIELMRDTTIRDDGPTIQAVVAAAAQRVELVFVTGGLGPTNDDVTRDALAAYLGRRVVMDDASLAVLRERMQQIGRAMTPARERQALIVEGAHVLPNPVGAAPGEIIHQNGVYFIVLPGPPVEFRALMESAVVPWLQEQVHGTVALRERVLLTHGLGEGDIVHRFEQADFPPAGIVTAFCAGVGRVEVRLHPADATVPDDALDQAAATAAALLGAAVYATQRVELEELIGQRLRDLGWTIATAESCTGGLIGSRLTSVPGSSDYVAGGIVAYADAVKHELLGVDAALLRSEGAVSAAVAEAMAVGVRQRLGADVGVSVTGIAGPGGGSADKPVGLVFSAVALPDQVEVFRDQFPGTRETVREAACRALLMRAWQALRGR